MIKKKEKDTGEPKMTIPCCNSKKTGQSTH